MLVDLIKLYPLKNVGPNRTFSILHVIRTIQLLGEFRILGRTLLSRKLKTGSGAIRTIINDLEKINVIKINRNGCQLSKNGINIYKELREKIPKISLIDAGHLSIDKFDAAAHVKNSSKIIGSGISQRDEAIKAGATGSSSLIYNNNRFIVPRGSKDCEKEFPGRIWLLLRETFNLEEDDVIIICSAKNEDLAIYGALASALSLFQLR
jgi:hypothetical protein